MSKKKYQKNGWTTPVFGPEVDEMEERIRRHYRSSPDHEWLGHLLGVIDRLRGGGTSVPALDAKLRVLGVLPPTQGEDANPIEARNAIRGQILQWFNAEQIQDLREWLECYEPKGELQEARSDPTGAGAVFSQDMMQGLREISAQADAAAAEDEAKWVDLRVAGAVFNPFRPRDEIKNLGVAVINECERLRKEINLLRASLQSAPEKGPGESQKEESDV